MWRGWYVFIVAALLAPVVCASGGSGKDDPAALSKPRLFASWRSLKARDESPRRYTIVRSIPKLKAGDPRVKTTIRMSVGPGYLLALGAYSDGKEWVVARNPHYNFSLDKREGKKEWSLSSYDEEKNVQASKCLQMLFGGGRQLAYPLSTFLGKTGDEYERSVEFVRVAPEGVNLRRVHYKRQVPAAKGGRPRVTDGEMVVDPARECCVLDMMERPPRSPSPYRVQREVAEIDGQLVCTRIVVTLPNGEVETYEFRDYDVRNGAPAHEHYLSHYGLPEPLDVTAPRASRPWWPFGLGAAAILCFCGALVFWRKARPGSPEVAGSSSQSPPAWPAAHSETEE